MKIITNSKNQEKVNPFQRHNFLAKEDMQTTFAYGLVAVMVSFAAWGLLTSYYKQITK